MENGERAGQPEEVEGIQGVMQISGIWGSCSSGEAPGECGGRNTQGSQLGGGAL